MYVQVKTEVGVQSLREPSPSHVLLPALRQCLRGTLVTLSPPLLQASSRSDYPSLLPVGIAKGSIGCDPDICLAVVGAESSMTNAIDVKRWVRKQKMCEKKTDKYMRREWDPWPRKYLQISMQKRPISRAKQKQKQQNDIDSASVCCFKLLEFELFESLLIGASWLTASYRARSRLTKYWRIDDDKKLRRRRAELTA